MRACAQIYRQHNFKVPTFGQRRTYNFTKIKKCTESTLNLRKRQYSNYKQLVRHRDSHPTINKSKANSSDIVVRLWLVDCRLLVCAHRCCSPFSCLLLLIVHTHHRQCCCAVVLLCCYSCCSGCFRKLLMYMLVAIVRKVCYWRIKIVRTLWIWNTA